MNTPVKCNSHCAWYFQMEYKIPDVSTLKRIRSLSELNVDQLIALANQLQIFTAKKGDLLLERGSIDESSIYLLRGSISLIAADGQIKQLTVSENEELNPVAKLRPCIYDIQAQETIEYLKINKQALVEFSQMSVTVSGDISVYSLYSNESDHTKFLIQDLYRNLMNEEVKLPSLPSAAFDISQLYQDDTSDADKLSQVLLSYPEISLKLIKKEDKGRAQDLQELPEIMRDIAGRLGTKRAYYMIMTHVINKLFLSQPGELTEALKPYQKHSLEVAAISRVLAKITPGIDPDMAMLAGMSHEIGSVVIMNFLINNDNFSLDPDESAQAVNTLGPEFTSLLLKRWQFNDEIVQAAEGSEDWFRNQGDAIDLCDLVLVANYHTLMNTDRVATLPPVSTLPVMKKMNITQDESITLIEKSSSEREKIARMLRF